MKSFLITFRSITYAQKAELALSRAGMKCRLRRTPRWMEDRGCGYGVEVAAPDPGEAMQILKAQQIPWQRRWLLKPGGEMEEMGHDLP